MNIRDVLTELGIDFRSVGESTLVTNGWVGVECPFCGVGTGKHGLGINLAHGSCSCWKCGPHRLAEVLKEISGEPWQRIRELLGDVERVYEKEEKPKGKLVYPAGVNEMADCHRAYLKRRGFDPDEIHRLWNVHGIGLAARLAWRLFIPIADVRGKVVSWTTRAIKKDAEQRYWSASPEEEAVPAKSLLFGEQYCRHAVIICEGPFDVFRIGPGCVGTLGLSYSQEQVAKMVKYPIRAVCFDSEPKAQERARRLCESLAPYPGRTTRIELDAPDPGSASKKEIAKLREEFLK
jgi:hypothetical protein